MSFVARPYPEIVADVLTTLTAGVSGEVHRIAYDATARPPAVVEVTLERRPVARVSLVRGFLPNPDPNGEPLPRVFAPGDYELLEGPEGDGSLALLRFVRADRRPAPDTDIVVNYYPTTSEPSPITDVNVGSVARTLVEAVGKEIAQLYAQLNLAYDSAYLETATGSSLDRVVALLAQKRVRAGAAVGTVRFQRRAGSVGNITIPAGTLIGDGLDKVRYETVETRQMLAGESAAEVRVRGLTPATPVMEAGTLSVVQRAIAGVDAVTNPRPTTRAGADESDEDLRRRVSGALLSSAKGTIGALRNGLLMLPDVRGVAIEEEPNGVPGEIRVAVSLAGEDGGPLPPLVRNRIEELRPAGVRIIAEGAQTTEIAASLSLTLAGPPQPDAAVRPVQEAVRGVLLDRIGRLGPGETVRVGPLVAALLADDRLVDAKITLSPKGGETGAAGADFKPAADHAVTLDAADVAFAASAFAESVPGEGATETADASVVLRAIAEPGQTSAAVRAEIDGRLRGYLGGLRTGNTVDADTVLAALRNDALYAIDPLSLVLSITAGAQVVEVHVGAGPWTVSDGLAIGLASLEVMA